MKEFDVVVIGGGPGGYVSAVRASQLGLSTALVEKEQLGGTCVNWGCIPTKALLRNAEIIHLLSQGKSFGFQMEQVTVDYAAAHKRSRQVAKRQGKRVEVLLKSRNVTLLKGEARLEDQNTIVILPTGEKIRAKNIILATGSQPRKISAFDFDGEKIITSREALDLSVRPESIVIVGAGAIGLELATVWNRYGSKVTVLEMMPQILPTEEIDVSNEAKIHFEKNGVKVRNGVRVESIKKTETGVEVTILDGEVREVIEAEKALLAMGVAPNTGNLGLEELGLVMNRGFIEIDSQMRTNLPHIYAIGDITGKMCLAHVASAQGIIAAEAIAGQQTKELIYANVPRCVFGEIEVSSVGLTEKQAIEQGYEVMTIQSPFVPNGKAIALNENGGFIKLVADKKSKKLLGAHMVGSSVPELIAGPTGMIAMGATVEEMAQVVYPHPTLSEAIVEGMHALAGHGIHL